MKNVMEIGRYRFHEEKVKGLRQFRIKKNREGNIPQIYEDEEMEKKRKMKDIKCVGWITEEEKERRLQKEVDGEQNKKSEINFMEIAEWITEMKMKMTVLESVGWRTEKGKQIE